MAFIGNKLTKLFHLTLPFSNRASGLEDITLTGPKEEGWKISCTTGPLEDKNTVKSILTINKTQFI